MKIKNGMTMFAAAFVLAAALVSAAALPAAAGSWVDINKDGSSWMYLQDDGRFLCRNWLQEGETWYYLDNHGLMVTGRVAINGKYEVFDESGAWLYTAEDAMPAGPGGAGGTGQSFFPEAGRGHPDRGRTHGPAGFRGGNRRKAAGGGHPCGDGDQRFRVLGTV